MDPWGFSTGLIVGKELDQACELQFSIVETALLSLYKSLRQSQNASHAHLMRPLDAHHLRPFSST
jgi:hypothetical protein